MKTAGNQEHPGKKKPGAQAGFPSSSYMRLNSFSCEQKARCCVANPAVDMVFELGEVRDEHRDQLLRLGVVGGTISPGGTRIEDRAVDTVKRLRNGEAKIRIGAELGILQVAGKSSRQKRARRLDGHTLADAISAAGPAGVDEPAIHAVLADQLTQQVAVFRRVARHEGCAKACGEGGFRLGHALFRAGDLCGVTGEEVVHGLLRRQPGDRRQHAEGVGRQHDDRPWMAGNAGLRRIRDEVQRISAAGVFRQRVIVEVRNAVFVQHDVFQNRAETVGRSVDFWLGFSRKFDRLGVATALEIEDAMFAPAVLVIADQRACRIGRQRCLAGAGEAEEDGGIALRTDIRRAMHRHDALGGQQVVQNREDRLLIFAGIARTTDQNETLGQVAGDNRFRAATVAHRISLEARQIDDGKLLAEAIKRLALRPDQQITDEKRMPGKLGDDAGRQCVLLIGAADQVLHIESLAGGMRQHILMQQVEVRRRQRLVVIPPDRVFGGGIANDEFVLWRAAGVLASDGTQRSIHGQFGFAITDRVLV
ncbi:hypothetical protein AT6N2_C2567 [Agrobacterium tumefaciens]|nr:hypothetical protein AT6N2_C2567 [Agrobacterium tumefaciens]